MDFGIKEKAGFSCPCPVACQKTSLLNGHAKRFCSLLAFLYLASFPVFPIYLICI
ncbi:hypothetical protein KsCSTR_17360 [Candidatus Kuenenia stuttgartiensis]|uniref:Uncharacterized protein n=1 Tax=Kuenenia stuttgartiensis TaxID=174633 RepID=Q1Q241_KUEST|nr:hypothetical protein KsCSTR_17360 [Candidatus Kuenenia stuttgartiensis]CAJ74085.1 unknown protein [Candidatus Kuenenia stuttgartiensis]